MCSLLQIFLCIFLISICTRLHDIPWWKILYYHQLEFQSPHCNKFLTRGRGTPLDMDARVLLQQLTFILGWMLTSESVDLLRQDQSHWNKSSKISSLPCLFDLCIISPWPTTLSQSLLLLVFPTVILSSQFDLKLRFLGIWLSLWTSPPKCTQWTTYQLPLCTSMNPTKFMEPCTILLQHILSLLLHRYPDSLTQLIEQAQNQLI